MPRRAWPDVLLGRRGGAPVTALPRPHLHLDRLQGRLHGAQARLLVLLEHAELLEHLGQLVHGLLDDLQAVRVAVLQVLDLLVGRALGIADAVGDDLVVLLLLLRMLLVRRLDIVGRALELAQSLALVGPDGLEHLVGVLLGLLLQRLCLLVEQLADLGDVLGVLGRGPAALADHAERVRELLVHRLRLFRQVLALLLFDLCQAVPDVRVNLILLPVQLLAL
mmetsp:Transcript_26845/g.70216  ORF Transcript_26845/g.70216 Transcript_26845/m.70216 type:complete len:222 (+) Transcript_26845:480-1145(+)